MWAPTSNGAPDIVKTITGNFSSYVPSLGSAGLAFVDTSTSSIDVIDPNQAAGAAVLVRSLSGANTMIDGPAGVAWTPGGSLWVIDTLVAGNPGFELLRFGPGATGNVAPVQQISGSKTGLGTNTSLGGQSTLAGLPGNAVAVAPVSVDPSVSVFTSSQTGNVAPSRKIQVPTPSPHWLSEGVGSDPQGRIYIGSGDINGNEFGRLDIYGPTANGNDKPLLTLGGTKQRFQIPVLPSVSSNGTLALADLTLLVLGSSSQQSGRIEVFKPLFTKPGAPKSLKVKTTSKTATFSWKAPTNPSGTPVSYVVTVKKGSKAVLTKATGGTSLAVPSASLPSGRLTVSVKAVNAGGTGPAASKKFRS